MCASASDRQDPESSEAARKDEAESKMIGVAPTQSLMLKRWKAKEGGMPDEPVLASPISRRSTPSSPAVIQMPWRQNSGELVTDCVVRPTNLRQLSFEPRGISSNLVGRDPARPEDCRSARSTGVNGAPVRVPDWKRGGRFFAPAQWAVGPVQH